MTAINSIVTSDVGESGFPHPHKIPQSQAILPPLPVVQRCQPAPKGELWEVTIDGERKFGPASKEECEAFVVSLASPAAVADPVQPAVAEADSMRFSVILAPIDPEFRWAPKKYKTTFPCENSNLPLSIARELADFLNRIERRAKKGRLAIVTRRVTDSKGRWSVITIQGERNTLTDELVIRGVRMAGATLSEAIAETNRINEDIVAYAAAAKAWAVLALEPMELGIHEA